ncbi:MAG: tyrosine-type recombinase/integrase [Ktedonobacteraceae bacterium]
MDTCELWRKCAEQFIVQIYRRSNSVESLRKYTQVLKQFFAIYPKYPDTITRADVEEFMERPSESTRNRGATVTNATRNLRLTVLASFYRYASTYTIAIEEGTPEPLLQRPAPTIGVARGRPNRSYKAMSYEELQRFFAVIPRDTVLGHRDRALILTYYWTARRRSEILNLKWGDIEKTTFVERDGTRREGFQYRWFGKGHSTEGDVAELPGPAKAAIDAYLVASGRLATMTPESYVFAGTRNLPERRGKPMGSDVIAKTLKKYAYLAGLDAERLSIHSFRHSAARIRFESGEELRSVQRLLRHSSIATTDRYLSILLSPADNGVKLLEEKFGNL